MEYVTFVIRCTANLVMWGTLTKSPWPLFDSFSHSFDRVSLDLPQQGCYKSRIHPQITTDIWQKLICGATVLFVDMKNLRLSFFAEISSAAALKMWFYLHFRWFFFFFPASCGLKQNRLTLWAHVSEICVHSLILLVGPVPSKNEVWCSTHILKVCFIVNF